MKSKTSCFNRTLFFNLFKRFWPIFAAYLAIWLIILPVALGNSLGYEISQNTYNNDLRILLADAVSRVYSSGITGGVIMSGIFCLLTAMAAFSYLYNPRSVSMLCSLPIKREGVFLSAFSSGILWLLVSNVIVFLVSVGVETSYGVLQMGNLLQWLAMVCMMNLFFFGFAAFCASLTGHLLVLPFLYAVLNFTAYAVELFLMKLMAIFIYGASTGDSFNLIWLSPAVKMLSTKAESLTETMADGSVNTIGYSYHGWGALGIYAAVGLAFALSAMLLIRRRRMETAGDVVAIRPLKPIFKYCLSAGCALVFGTAIYWVALGSNNSLYGVKCMFFLLICVLIGAFIGYFAAEMLLLKTVRVFKGRTWIGFGITAALMAVLILCGEFDVFGYERNIPDSSRIQSVSISCSGENIELKQGDNINTARAIHSSIVSHKEKNEALTGSSRQNSYNVTFLYSLKNGNLLKRAYNIYYPATDDILSLTDLMNCKEAVNSRKETKIPVDTRNIIDASIGYFDRVTTTYVNIPLTAAQAYALYTNCIVPDMDDGTMGKLWFVTEGTDYDKSVYDCSVSITFISRNKASDRTNDFFRMTFTVNAARSNKWIKDNFGLSLCTVEESNKIMQLTDGNKKVAYAKAS